MSLFAKVRSLFRRQKLDVEMRVEMAAHLDAQAARNRTAGMNEDDARAAAHRRFGGVAQIQERCRGQRPGSWLVSWGRDLRIAARSLRRAPGFSTTVFLTLALCLGPNAAILSALYALVLKPLPFPAPEQLVTIRNVGAKAGGMPTYAGVPQYLDFAAQADRFERFVLFDQANTTIGEDSVPSRASGYRVTASFFAFFDVRPRLGEFFGPEAEATGRDRVLVLTEPYWRAHFNGEAGVIGREIRMGGENYTIIGVAPESLTAIFSGTDFLKPYGYAPAELDPQRRYVGNRTTLLGRLRPGVTITEGVAQLTLLEEQFRTGQAAAGLRGAIERVGLRVQGEPLRNPFVTQVQQPLWVLQAAAAFVLLIGAVNVANLLLARVNARRAEFAIRFALGARGVALLRAMLSEVLLLAGAAAVAGLALAYVSLFAINRGLNALGRFVPPVTVAPELAAAVVLGALLLATVIGGGAFALLWRTGLRVGDARTSSSRRGVRVFGSLLVITQVAVALVLLIAAGLLMQSFAHVVAVDPGFNAERVVQARIALSRAYEPPEANAAITRRILDAMQAIPGVEGVAASNFFGVGPASSFRSVPFTLRGEPEFSPENRPLAYIHPVSPGFFATLEGRVLLGREFDEADTSRENPVVVIDQAFAERHFPGRNPIGREMALGAGPFPEGFKWSRIVGVVARANITGLEARDGLAFLYLPMGKTPGPGFNVLVRSPREPADLLAAMRAALHDVDPTLPLYNSGTLRETLDAMLTPRRFTMLLLAIFAALALVLAAVGLYGVLAYDVTQRTREIGIRSAIGATRGQVVTLILGQGLRQTALGVAFGLGFALLGTRLLRTLLFDVSPFDPLAFVGVPGILILTALAACWLPARRAARVDPVIALRAE